MAELSTKTARGRLKIRREPHWMKLKTGCFLGFRRGPDTWIARFRGASKKQVYHSLDANTYDTAIREAEEWFTLQGKTIRRTSRRSTVKDALETYLADLKQSDRADTERTTRQRFEMIVWSDPLADVNLDTLTIDDMEEWRERLREGRANRTVNRHVASVTAGLNVAYRKGHIGNPESWRLPRLSDNVEHTAETTLFISKGQREAIMDHASPACAAFMQALYYTAARPKEMAEAKRGDFDEKSGTLTLKSKKGRPARLRPRTVYLTDGATAFFTRHARGKLPTAPLLLDPNGLQWGRHKWSDEIQLAVRGHDYHVKPGGELPAGLSAYSFRHARISELLQVHGIDVITVAQQTGTSVAMIEKYYFKFIAPAYKERLARIDSQT